MKLGEYELNQIYTGDARELAKGIPDESVDLIFTDPPYPKEFIDMYKWLSDEAARILKPDGLLFAYCGLVWFDVVLNNLKSSLNYLWICNLTEDGQTRVYHPKKVGNCWRPIVVFSKERQELGYCVDKIKSNGRNKQFHQWQQEDAAPAYYIRKLTTDCSIILDPFVGGGTFPAICKSLHRQFIGFEENQETAEKARQRILNMPEMLPFIYPDSYQGKLFDVIETQQNAWFAADSEGRGANVVV